MILASRRDAVTTCDLDVVAVVLVVAVVGVPFLVANVVAWPLLFFGNEVKAEADKGNEASSSIDKIVMVPPWTCCCCCCCFPTNGMMDDRSLLAMLLACCCVALRRYVFVFNCSK